MAELKDIYFVREVLEETAAQLAAPKLTKDAKARLKQLAGDMNYSTKRSDFARLLQLNREFHFSIYASCGNDLLVEMIAGLWDRSSRYRHLYTHLPERAPRALAEHVEIYEACLAGNAKAAGRAVRNNVRQTVEGLTATLRDSIEP
jgi:DNA-binding GntR family transcriptional regulator